MGSLARAGLALAVLLAGCGSESDTGSSPPLFDLVVTFWPEGSPEPVVRATLTCEPAGGTHPDPEAACAALLANEQALDPVSGDVACTEIYGGPQEATIVGRGREVNLNAALNRTNGCEIDRWEKLKPVVDFPASR